ncbi:MAG: pentapeptide repeat-containing protein, partial [Chloroflexota bacterium]
DGVGGFGNAVLAWRTDDGTSWNRLATARPVETGSASAFVAAPDGSVYLGTTDDTGATARYRHSVAGVLASTTACTAAAHADCAFSTLTGSFAGADLSGINLYGATIAAGADLGGANLSGARLTGLLAEAGVNLTKANLTGADLTRATLAEGVVLAGANLTRADLSFAHISVATADSTGITLAGSNLRNASLPAVDFAGMSLKGTTIAGTSVGPTFLRANFAGARLSDVSVGVDADGTAGSMSGYAFGNRNLAGWFFGGTALHGPGSLRGADFTHAKVDGLSFYNVDLTGARFPKGTRSKTDYGSGRGVLFSGEVVCPDGKAPKAVGTLYDCRLGG